MSKSKRKLNAPKESKDGSVDETLESEDEVLEFGDTVQENSSGEEDNEEVESDGENDPGPIFADSDEGSGAEEDESDELEFEDDADEDESDDGDEGDDESKEEEESDNESSVAGDVKESETGSDLKKSVDKETATKVSEAVSGEGPTKEISKTKVGAKKTGKADKEDEDNDTSDEEDLRNTVGNIPMNWYDDYPHLGYDWEGKKILKPEKSDQLDEFLKRMEDPDFWRTVSDAQTGQKVKLSDSDLDTINRMMGNKNPDGAYDEYAPWVEWFSSQVMKMPLTNAPPHKRSFLPSKPEKEKVSKLVNALKMGWIKTESEKSAERRAKSKKKYYNLWKNDDQEYIRRIHNHIAPPKRALPGHAESYNPPAEYLFDNKEMKEWKKHAEEPWKRKLHYLPQKHDALRHVPAYDRFVQERFQRCLDLYLCPRGRKMRLMIEPEDLVPKLPSPADLQPFPTVQSIIYEGHTDMVRSIAVDAKGQYLVSGSDDTTVKVWEVATGRCVKTIPCGGIVRSVSWCPSQALSLLLVAADRKVLLINPGVGDTLVVSKTDTLLEEEPPALPVAERISAVLQWEQPETTSEEYERGVRVIINHFKEVTQVTWHGRGDYFASLMPDAQHRSVLIHQLSRRRSQMPFNKNKGLAQKVLFHPIRPFLFVAYQRNIRVYDLVKQEIVKKLTSPARWISSIAVHPAGDNVLVGTYDRKIMWYDLDLSTTPYQTLRLHNAAVRGVAFHSRYPLFASASDDKSVIVSHGMVYSDLLQSPLIVPLKRLSYHEEVSDIAVCDVVFHPTQPWVFSSGADKTIRLFT